MAPNQEQIPLSTGGIPLVSSEAVRKLPRTPNYERDLMWFALNKKFFSVTDADLTSRVAAQTSFNCPIAYDIFIDAFMREADLNSMNTSSCIITCGLSRIQHGLGPELDLIKKKKKVLEKNFNTLYGIKKMLKASKKPLASRVFSKENIHSDLDPIYSRKDEYDKRAAYMHKEVAYSPIIEDAKMLGMTTGDLIAVCIAVALSTWDYPPADAIAVFKRDVSLFELRVQKIAEIYSNPEPFL